MSARWQGAACLYLDPYLLIAKGASGTNDLSLRMRGGFKADSAQRGLLPSTKLNLI